MICRSCAFRLGAFRPLRQLPARQLQTRHNSGTTAAPRSPDSGSHEGPPAATSTSAAQPFSNSLVSSLETSTPDAATIQAAPKSSVLAGTPLKGLGYFKNKEAPRALEDHEYPNWLWGLLDEGKNADQVGGGAEGDAYAKSKKQRRIAAKAVKKAALLNPEANLPKVPLEHQTIDLPRGDGTTTGAVKAGKARKELTSAMRDGRRKGIKERNFLQGMR